MEDVVVELKGVNGEWFNLTTGDRGVYLGTDPEGLYDPPVKVVYEEPGNYPGARYLNHRILRRDVVFGVEILNDGKGYNSWLSRDSEWRKAWAFDRDCELYITTPESGTRYLKLRLGESPEVKMHTYPQGNTVNRCAMVCIAGDPFWYEEDVVAEAYTTQDTTFDPNPLPWPWPKEELPEETLTISVYPGDEWGSNGLNPTDNYIFPKWILPGSTEKPAEPYIPGLPWLGAPNSPATIWTVPDYSFEDDELANRRIQMPGLIGGLWTNEVQRIYIDGRPTGGTFTLKLGEETTDPIPYNCNSADIKAALEALAAVAYNDVKVTRDRKTNEVQYIDVRGGATGGSYQIEFDGYTTSQIDYNANSFEIWAKLNALDSTTLWDIRVTEEIVREEQIVTLVGEPQDGTFTLTLDGYTTDPIPWNAGAIRMHNELIKLPNIDLFDITVTKDWKRYAPWKIRFNGTGLAGVDVTELTGDPTGLIGGAGMDVEVETITQGSHRYRVEFLDELAAYNLPQMTVASESFEGGTDPEVVVTTEVDGSYPFVVEFQNNLGGQNMDLVIGDGSGFTSYVGTTPPTVRCNVAQEGRTYPGENAVIDTDTRVEQVASENGAELWSRMNGVRFRHPIPPYTERGDFELTVSGQLPGQLVTLRLVRAWTRPWGLE
jgi:hypothetical protein